MYTVAGCSNNYIKQKGSCADHRVQLCWPGGKLHDPRIHVLKPRFEVMDHRVEPGGDDSELFFEVATQLKSLNRTTADQVRA
jgi:hypothetical protein